MDKSANPQLTADQVEMLRNRLRDLPPKPPAHRSAKEVVAALEAEIRAAQAKGYTLADIAAIYSELGQVSASTLQSYLRDLERSQAAASVRRRRPPTSATISAAERTALPAAAKGATVVPDAAGV